VHRHAAQARGGGQTEVGILAHDHRRFAAQFQHQPLDRGRRLRLDRRAHRIRSGEADHIHPRIARQQRATAAWPVTRLNTPGAGPPPVHIGQQKLSSGAKGEGLSTTQLPITSA
jgi:hypothetical protein